MRAGGLLRGWLLLGSLQVATLLASGSVVGIAPAFAQVPSCGDPPIVADESLKGTIDGKANLLSRYLGHAELGGKLETAKTDIFSKYPKAGEARGLAYFQYVMCSLLMSDHSLTTREKVDEWMRVKAVLQPDQPTNDRGGPAKAGGATGNAGKPEGNYQRSDGKCSPNVNGGVSGQVNITC